MKKTTWVPKPGELVQVWDHVYTQTSRTKICHHGKVGYLVKRECLPTHVPTATPVWKIICFGADTGEFITAHESWLNPISKSSDIRKVEDA